MSKILIADDDAAMREWLARLLVSRSDLPLEAANGREALEIARQQAPDLVLSDVLMPVMDGFELLRQLRLDPATASIPVILISGAYDNAAAQALAAAGGAVALVRKPYRPEEIFEPIDVALAPGRRPAETAAAPADFGRDHLRLLMDKLSEKAAEAEQAGERLRKSESLLAEAQALAHIGSWEWDITAGTVTWSEENYRIMGLEPREAPATYASFLNCLHPDDRARIDEALQQAFRDYQPFSYECRAILPNGDLRHQHVKGTVFTDQSGRAVRMFGTIQDITERKVVEEALRESQQTMRLTLDAAHIGNWDLDLVTLTANGSPQHDQIFGYEGPLAEWSYDRFLTHVHPEDREDVDRLFRAGVAAGTEWDTECRILRRDGALRWIWVHGNVFPNAAGEAVRMLGMVRDITQRKRSEQAIERGLQRLNEAQRIGQTGDWEFDVATQAITWSPQVFVILGRDPRLGPHRDYEENAAIFEAASRALMEKVTHATASGKAQEYELLGRRPGGEQLHVHAVAVPIKDENGRVCRVYGTVQDISARKKADEQLAHFAELFQALSHRLLDVQEEERRHLARELHDEIGQTLTAAKLNLKIIAPEAPPAVAGRIEDSIELLDRLLQQVRQLSLDLRPPLLDELGLVPALRWLVDQQAQRARLRVTFTTSVEDLKIDPAVQTACFRVAQEAITNAIRHARAVTLAVELRAEPDHVWLVVRDDGVGFDKEAVRQPAVRGASIGLLSMNERVSLLGGELEVSSAPGRGTEIRAWFPLACREPHSTSEPA